MSSKNIRRVFFGALALVALGFGAQEFLREGWSAGSVIPSMLGLWWGFGAATGSGCG